jgi:hypothetical protein
LFTIIARRFDEQYRVEFDYSGVEALQAKRDSQLARISLHISHGIPPADAYAYEGLSSAPISNDAISDMPNEEIIIEDEIEEAFDLSEYKKKVLIKGR